MFQPVADAMPVDLSGWSVLDIGGYDGEYSEMALARGASQVTLVDNEEWRQYVWNEPVAQYEKLAADSRWRYEKCEFQDWHEPADLVLFGNVWYHVREPLPAIQHVRSLTRRMALIWTRFANQLVNEQGWRYWSDGMGHQNGTVYCTPADWAALEAVRDVFAEAEELARWSDHLLIKAITGEST